ncbi:MarR family winged helix-turn-helix transcriptional regulator [Cryobacterium sp. Hh11]|uniref:MarR family winged helix-turn-helix transcriptional regulator n=1 Tax=Cryobacterium sp. Hh11 TaxID=2555868 RepID=UPI0018E09F20|nr:MarR family winged helix-turn-helix transcriptional regulator [Cryobacterium sp. Hh11]
MLSTVIHRDLPSQQAIGAHLAIDRTVLIYLLDGMVDAQLVERIPDPTDRRARKIRAPTEGSSVHRADPTASPCAAAESLAL